MPSPRLVALLLLAALVAAGCGREIRTDDPQEPPPLLRDRFTWVEREGTQIHLVPVDDPIAAREGHVAIVADDYEATLARLDVAGFEVSEGSNAWNAPRVFATDASARRQFTAYWHIIYPGSAIIRRSWLRAIQRRATR